MRRTAKFNLWTDGYAIVPNMDEEIEWEIEIPDDFEDWTKEDQENYMDGLSVEMEDEITTELISNMGVSFRNFK